MSDELVKRAKIYVNLGDRIEALEAERNVLKGIVGNYARASMEDAAALNAEREKVARLREALRRWESYGCPDCHGDCASANPPVAACIMRDTHEALK